jgi:hypothetical protein
MPREQNQREEDGLNPYAIMWKITSMPLMPIICEDRLEFLYAIAPENSLLQEIQN